MKYFTEKKKKNVISNFDLPVFEIFAIHNNK